MSETGAVRLAGDARVAELVIERAAVHNALDCAMWSSLLRLCDEIEARGPAVLILRGAGPSFSAGSDLRELESLDGQGVEAAFAGMERAIARVERLAVPTVALLHGYALGSALVLACACDLRLGCAGLHAGMPIGRLGISLGRPFLRRLTSLCGPARTKDLIYSGRLLTAEQSLGRGLVDHVLPGPGPECEAELGRFAGDIASMYPSALLAAKRALMPEATEEPAYVVEQEAAFREGLARFLAGRAAARRQDRS